MKRGLAVAATCAAFAALSGCQTWRDKADSAALAECARIADAAKRKTCQSDVIAAAGEAERRRLDAEREAALAREEREALREAYGLPDKTN